LVWKEKVIAKRVKKNIEFVGCKEREKQKANKIENLQFTKEEY